MLTKKKMSRQTKGFTLTEAAIVLGIMGLILGAIWVAAASVYSNQRINTTSRQILEMVASIRSLYATSSSLDVGTTELLLAQAGAIPKDLMKDPNGIPLDGDITNVWNGKVTVVPDNAGGIARTGFLVTFAGVPSEACSSILVRFAGQGRDAGLFSISGNGAAQTTFPVSVANAIASCTDASGVNSLKIIFRLRA